MKKDISNIPLNTIYRFDINKYIMATMQKGDNDTFISDEPKRILWVYQIDNDGSLIRIAHGTLVDKPDVYDYSRGFSIQDFDKDMNVSFRVTMELQELTLNELYDLKDAVAKNYKKVSQ